MKKLPAPSRYTLSELEDALKTGKLTHQDAIIELKKHIVHLKVFKNRYNLDEVQEA